MSDVFAKTSRQEILIAEEEIEASMKCNFFQTFFFFLSIHN